MAYVINRPDFDAMQRLLERNPDSTLGVILRLAWLEGLTREEIVGLTWADIYLERGELTLPDRTIPFFGDMEACLLARLRLYGRTSPHVVISDKFQDVLQPQSVSRLVRQALDAEGMHSVRLTDLRHDFVLRQLDQRDWAQVVRMSGLSVPSFQAIYAGFMKTKLPTKKAVQGDDEYKMWKILQTNKESAIGLALWMRWQMGLQLTELVELTWDRVDLEANLLHLPGREVEISQGVRSLLKDRRDRRGEGEDPHVLLTERSRKPLDSVYLSKCMRTMLIRGGVEDVTFRNIQRNTDADVEKLKITNLAKTKNGITRSDVVKALGLSGAAASRRLGELVREGGLVQVYAKYYLPDSVVPVERQEAAVRDYLEANGTAALDDLVFLLQLERRQCGRILKRMVAEGVLAQEGKLYRLPEEASKGA